MRILIYGAGVIGEKSMKNEEYKKKCKLKSLQKQQEDMKSNPCWHLRNVQEGLSGYSGRIREGAI